MTRRSHAIDSAQGTKAPPQWPLPQPCHSNVSLGHPKGTLSQRPSMTSMMSKCTKRCRLSESSSGSYPRLGLGTGLTGLINLGWVQAYDLSSSFSDIHCHGDARKECGEETPREIRTRSAWDVQSKVEYQYTAVHMYRKSTQEECTGGVSTQKECKRGVL